MRRTCCPLLLLLVLVACQSRENLDEVEAGAAAAASTENQVATYARRVRRAEAKLSDYDKLALGVETRLKAKRAEVRELRAEVGRRAQEAQGLKKETQTLDAELKAQKDKLAAVQATIESETLLIAAAATELRALEDERRGWVIRLEEARALHHELADIIVPLIARLPSFKPAAAEPEVETETGTEMETDSPTSQPAPEAAQPQPPTAEKPGN